MLDQSVLKSDEYAKKQAEYHDTMKLKMKLMLRSEEDMPYEDLKVLLRRGAYNNEALVFKMQQKIMEYN